MKKSLSVILITIFLDAVGIGLIMPILPELLRSLAGAEAGGVHYGALLAVYALMQKIKQPLAYLEFDIAFGHDLAPQ